MKTKTYISFIFLLYTLQTVSAQNFVTNDGLSLTFQAGLVSTIQGGYTNKTNGTTLTLGTIDNAGTITLTGDWTNNSANTVFSTNTGAVQLIGTTAGQTINGTNSTGFYNLTVNNTFATSPQITQGVNTDVKNTLTMTAGNINIAGFTVTLGTAAATPGALSHGGTSVSGWMYGGNFIRYFDAVTIADGAVAGMFPLGSSTDFRPIYYSAPLIAPTTGGIITLSHTNATTVSNVSFADGLSTVARRHDAYWTALTGGGMTGGTYNLRAEGTGLGLIGAVADLRLTLSGSAVGTAGTNAGTTTNPQVNRTGLTLLELSNNFYIGSVDAVSSPLPIELISFNAKFNSENHVDLTWITATETNNDFFTIEKTKDGILFEQVDKVDGAGNSTQVNSYSTVDKNPYSGISYYRLKQTDFDGKYEYSNLVSVEQDNSKSFNFNVFPNPSNGENIILHFNNSEEKILVVIRDVLGRECYSKLITIETGENIYAIDKLENISPGIYWVSASSNDEMYSIKMVIQ